MAQQPQLVLWCQEYLVDGERYQRKNDELVGYQYLSVRIRTRYGNPTDFSCGVKPPSLIFSMDPDGPG